MHYLYEGHLGGVYWTDREQSFEETYCDECGDSDWLLGSAKNKEEALKLIDDWAHPDRYSNDPELTQEDREWCQVAPDYLQELIDEVEKLFNK